MGTSDEHRPSEALGPLNGVRVLDLSGDRAGGVSAMLLADLGADVVRLIDPARPTAIDSPAGAICWDRGKRLVRSDNLASDLATLLPRCDIVIIDDAPHRATTTGRTATALAAAAPTAIICWLPANGTEGPIADLPSDPLIASAISGFAQLQSCASDTPIAPVVPVMSYIHAVLGAAASVAGLIERRRSGLGQIVSTTTLHTATLLTATLAGDALDHASVIRPKRDPRTSPSFRTYRCGDGRWIFLGALGPALFFAALDAMGLLDIMVQPGIDGEFLNLFVGDNALRVSDALEARFAESDSATWLDRLGAAGVPVSIVQSRAEWTADPLYLGIGGQVRRPHPTLGEVTLPGPPITMSATPVRVGGFPTAVDLNIVDELWSTPDVPKSDTRPVAASPTPPLAGVRVLDLSTYMAGPMSALVLAQWGADVIKVEPTHGDGYRVFTLSYAAVNQGKRSVTIDLTKPADRAAFDRLAATADVVIDNLRPAVRRHAGLDSDELRTAHPGLVHTTISAFGDDGPAADRPGFDPVLQALSGIMHEAGDDDTPYYTSTGIHDVGTGTLAVLGTVAALWARDRIGHGQRVSVALARTTQLVQLEELTEFPGRPPTPRGAPVFVGAEPGRRYYRASDGWVALCAEPDRLAGLLAWSGDPAPEPLRSIADAVAVRTVAAVVEELTTIGIPSTAVVADRDRATSEHLRVHRVLHVVEDRDIGRCLINNEVAAWSRSPIAEARTAPPLSKEVPQWWDR